MQYLFNDYQRPPTKPQAGHEPVAINQYVAAAGEHHSKVRTIPFDCRSYLICSKVVLLIANFVLHLPYPAQVKKACDLIGVANFIRCEVSDEPERDNQIPLTRSVGDQTRERTRTRRCTQALQIADKRVLGIHLFDRF